MHFCFKIKIRDIKPENILMHYEKEKDEVYFKISDYGLSRELLKTDVKMTVYGYFNICLY